MDDEMVEVRSDIAETRARMSESLNALEARVSDAAKSVQRKFDPTEAARAHPWLALAVAAGAGVALSASGADRKAASATARAGRRAPKATARAAKRASRKAADTARHALHGGAEDATAAPRRRGPLGRLTGGLRDAIDTRLAELVQNMWRASVEIRTAAESSAAAPTPGGAAPRI